MQMLAKCSNIHQATVWSTVVSTVLRDRTRNGNCARIALRNASPTISHLSTSVDPTIESKYINVLGQRFISDEMTNVSASIMAKLGKSLHNQHHHPIHMIRSRIQDYFYRNFVGRTGNPIFAVFDNLNPIVTLQQNFDSLLVPPNHPSRNPKDSFYINNEHMLRAHMTSHDCDIIAAGLDRFLTVGDVFRRDTIDKTHYPIFHQLDGVRIYTETELFQKPEFELRLFEKGDRTPEKQATHTVDTVELLAFDLKKTLSNMALSLFGKDVEYRWVEAYFPFTHPSWELEIMYQGDWLEVLGCGLLEQQILTNCGVTNKVGWAFGLGLERLAMKLYGIPDVRLFWSTDPGFLSQFKIDDPHQPVTYKEFSKFPPLSQDISFWIDNSYSSNDFFDLARVVGGDLVEQISVIDQFTHPKTGRTSHTYRITYRHMHRTLTTQEVNQVQSKLRELVHCRLGCEVRIS